MSTEKVFSASELLSETLIQDQLQKIFLCPVFAVSDILRRFLSHIVQETLAGRSNTIKEYTIAVNVLNKPVSFKPQHDAIVRIHAGRLRRALNYYYKETGAGDPIEISVPKGSYVPVFTSNINREIKSATPEILSTPTSLFETVKIAIMPFRTLDPDLSRMAFADSLGQQLSAEFSRFADFSVVSYYTTQQLATKNREIQELAAVFGAQYVITGTVQFESRRLRVSVQLTDTSSGTQIWTEMYHRPYSSADYFEVADDIVTHIIGVLGDYYGLIVQQIARGIARNKSGKPYATMLSSYHDFYNTFSEESFKKSYEAMELEVEQNPQNEIAWAFFGELSLVAFLFNHPTKENPLLQGLKCARAALKINPQSQHGHITLGMAYIFLNNKKASLEALNLAMILNPSAFGFMGIIGCLMISVGEYDRGIDLIEKSIEWNKSYPPFFNLFISLYHFKQKEYMEAYIQAEKIDMPDLVLNNILKASTLTKLGRIKEADALIKTIKGYSLNKTWISREYLQRFFLDRDLVEQLNKGLKSASLTILSVA